MKILEKGIIGWSLVVLTNLFLIGSIVKVLFIDPQGDVNALFAMFAIFAAFVFNIYAVIVNGVLRAYVKDRCLSELLFSLFILLPLLGFIYLICGR